MRSKIVGLMILCFVLIVAFGGCEVKQPIDEQADSRVFVIKDGKMTDGELIYKRLPDNWVYRGKYPYKIGTMKDGNALYASDKNGTIVQEAKSWYQDMEYWPWVLDSVEFPPEPDETFKVCISPFKGKGFYLSEKAREEVITWYLDGRKNSFGITHDHVFASVFFEMEESVPGLYYDGNYWLVFKEERLMIVDNSDVIRGEFSPDTAFYQEVLDATGGRFS